MVEERRSEHQQHEHALTPRVEEQARDEQQGVLTLVITCQHRQQEGEGKEQEKKDWRAEHHCQRESDAHPIVACRFRYDEHALVWCQEGMLTVLKQLLRGKEADKRNLRCHRM